MAEMHKVKVFQQENSGVFSARNKSIDISEGGYLWFIDVDDWLAEQALEKIKIQVLNN